MQGKDLVGGQGGATPYQPLPPTPTPHPTTTTTTHTRLQDLTLRYNVDSYMAEHSLPKLRQYRWVGGCGRRSCCLPYSDITSADRVALVQAATRCLLTCTCDPQAPALLAPAPTPRRSHEWDSELASEAGALHDSSSAAIAIDFEKCLRCGRCVTACDTVQDMNVLGMAGRGRERHPALITEAMSLSKCISCGQVRGQAGVVEQRRRTCRRHAARASLTLFTLRLAPSRQHVPPACSPATRRPTHVVHPVCSARPCAPWAPSPSAASGARC